MASSLHRRLLLAACLAGIGASNSVAHGLAAEVSDFSLGIGYAHLSIGDSDSELSSENAFRLEFASTFAPIPDLPQLRLGGAFGIAAVLDNKERTIISDGGLVIAGSADIPLVFLEPELRLSWRQYLGETFYIEPGIAGGGVFAHLDIDNDDDDDTTVDDPSYDEWDQVFSARAFINVGFEVSGGFAGFQFSYLRGGDLELAQNAAGATEEFYVGFFGALAF